MRAYDYQAFFERLLGPAWVVFEVAYLLFVILILSTLGAAAGAIGAATLGTPPLALAAAIAGFAIFGSAPVERLFKYVSFLLYGVYALFVLLALTHFGHRIAQNFAAPAPSQGWALGGLTYASYNIVGAVVILPVIRHVTSQRNAVIAGLIAGPLAMRPALLFFVCMIGFYPGMASQALPSDFILQRLDPPLFHMLFQLMLPRRRARGARGRTAGRLHLRRGPLRPRRADRQVLSFSRLCIFLAVYVVPLLTLGSRACCGGGRAVVAVAMTADMSL